MEENKKEKEIIEVQKVEDSKVEENKAETKTESKTETETKANTTNKEPKRKKGLCIASMVLGIITLVFFCVWYISIPCGILSIIFGVLGIKTVDKGMAITGIVTGSIGLFVSLCIIMMMLLFIFIFGIREEFDDSDNILEHKNYNTYYRSNNTYRRSNSIYD